MSPIAIYRPKVLTNSELSSSSCKIESKCVSLLTTANEVMLTKAWDTTADCTVALLLHYIFDLSGYNARELVERWLNYYPANWVRLAVIEALYQGRYKAISVEQILASWQRRSQTLPHFNCEFERLVCGNIQPRLPRQANPNPAPNSCPVFKPLDHLNHTTGTALQTVDITAKVLPQTKEVDTVKLQQHRQAGRYNQTQIPARSQLALPGSTNQQPIKQFNPQTKTSDFYTKLKAIAQHN